MKKGINKFLLAILFIALATTTITSCKSKTSENTVKTTNNTVEKENELTLETTDFEIQKGKSVTFDTGLRKTTDYKWESSNTDILTIDESGKVTAVWYGGCYVTATLKDKIYKCYIKVIPAPWGYSESDLEKMIRAYENDYENTVSFDEAGWDGKYRVIWYGYSVSDEQKMETGVLNWFSIDKLTGKGTDISGKKIDLTSIFVYEGDKPKTEQIKAETNPESWCSQKKIKKDLKKYDDYIKYVEGFKDYENLKILKVKNFDNNYRQRITFEVQSNDLGEAAVYEKMSFVYVNKNGKIKYDGCELEENKYVLTNPDPKNNISDEEIERALNQSIEGVGEYEYYKIGDVSVDKENNAAYVTINVYAGDAGMFLAEYPVKTKFTYNVTGWSLYEGSCDGHATSHELLNKNFFANVYELVLFEDGVEFNGMQLLLRSISDKSVTFEVKTYARSDLYSVDCIDTQLTDEEITFSADNGYSYSGSFGTSTQYTLVLNDYEGIVLTGGDIIDGSFRAMDACDLGTRHGY